MARLPHRVCPGCGFYNGVVVIAPRKAKKIAETITETEVDRQ
jgi:hypothetical protein